MDKHMEKKRKWEALRTGLLTAAAVMLVMSALMGTAWAYFSTYASAKGGITLHMGHEEKVEEDFNSWQKVINITSTKDSRPVYIRASPGRYISVPEVSALIMKSPMNATTGSSPRAMTGSIIRKSFRPERQRIL